MLVIGGSVGWGGIGRVAPSRLVSHGRGGLDVEIVGIGGLEELCASIAAPELPLYLSAGGSRGVIVETGAAGLLHRHVAS